MGPTRVGFGPARWSVQFELQGTTSGVHDLGNLIKRFVCFALLNRVPNEGLGEVIESLRDAVDFYRSPGGPSHHQLAAHTGRPASKGKALERPGLVLDDEG